MLQMLVPLLLVAATPAHLFERKATAAEQRAGDALAREMVKALGGAQAFGRLQVISFSYVLKTGPHELAHRHIDWDVHAGLCHVVGRHNGQRIEAYLHLGDRSGRVFRDDVAVADPAAAVALLNVAFGWWSNDSYWLVAPFKVFDHGARRAVIDGRLRITFDHVGLTPGDVYFYRLDRHGYPLGWEFRRQSGRQQTFVFEQPQQRQGVVFFARKVSRGPGPVTVVTHPEIQVFTTPQPQLFQPLEP